MDNGNAPSKGREVHYHAPVYALNLTGSQLSQLNAEYPRGIKYRTNRIVLFQKIFILCCVFF